MVTRLRDLGIELTGWALLALAVIFSVLPVIPTLLLLGALVILSSRYAWAGRLLEKARRYMPWFFRPEPKTDLERFLESYSPKNISGLG